MHKVPRRILIGLGILLLLVGLAGLIAWELLSSAVEAKYLANLAQRDAGTFPDPNSFCGIPTGFPRIFNLPDQTRASFARDLRILRDEVGATHE